MAVTIKNKVIYNQARHHSKHILMCLGMHEISNVEAARQQTNYKSGFVGKIIKPY